MGRGSPSVLVVGTIHTLGGCNTRRVETKRSFHFAKHRIRPGPDISSPHISSLRRLWPEDRSEAARKRELERASRAELGLDNWGFHRPPASAAPAAQLLFPSSVSVSVCHLSVSIVSSLCSQQGWSAWRTSPSSSRGWRSSRRSWRPWARLAGRGPGPRPRRRRSSPSASRLLTTSAAECSKHSSVR